MAIIEELLDGERPARLTCSTSSCSRFDELEGLIRLNGNTIKLVNLDDGFNVRVTSARGGAAPVYDSRAGLVLEPKDDQ